MDLNRATILGRLTRDPELKTIPSGKAVASFAIATNKVWTDQSGNKQEQVEFHNCVLWGKLGEIAGQYLTKGKRIYLEGRIQTRDWVGKDGVKKYRTEIVADNMIMLDGPRGSEKSGGGNAPQANVQNAPSSFDANSEEEIKVEDIPF